MALVEDEAASQRVAGCKFCLYIEIRECQFLAIEMWTCLHSSTQIKALYLDIASTCQIPAAQGLYWEEMVNNQEKYKVLLAQYVENLYFSKVDDLLNEKCSKHVRRENISAPIYAECDHMCR